jgi:hypothetical protein
MSKEQDIWFSHPIASDKETRREDTRGMESTIDFQESEVSLSKA